ncbi:MAG: hypothetical protein ACHQFW_06455 [Chitinophagales bacterium]
MKKLIPFVFCAIVAMGTTSASNTPNVPATPNTPENKLSAEEITRMTNRFKEIQDMDKKDLNFQEKKELRQESSQIKETLKADGGYLYISGAALILIIILLIILI